MLRTIAGYFQDAENHWVAELRCGHGQHVRHQPPMTSRPWVLTPEGRASMLGTEMDCVRCDRLELPEGLVAYQRTSEFDQNNIPKGLTAHHSTKPGVWGVIHVSAGTLRYVIDGMNGRELVLEPKKLGIIAPELMHHVVTEGPVKFFVEFHRKPAAAA